MPDHDLIAPINWKKNLAALWIAQFLSLSAFSFSLPFVPLYLKQSGMVPQDDAAAWASFFLSSASLSMMIMAPIWGGLGDRFGRKMMLVRANLGGAVALYFMGVVDSIEMLIVLRFLQGAFTGTIPAAQTLITTSTPDRNQGMAMGFLMASVNAGNMAGVFFGGMCARVYGGGTSFKISGAMLLASAIISIFLVKENFVPPEPVETRKSQRLRTWRTVGDLSSVFLLLFGIAFVGFIQSFDGPFFSLFVDQLYQGALAGGGELSEEAARQVYGLTGVIGAVASVAAVVGSVMAGFLTDMRKPPAWLMIILFSGLGALGMAASRDLWDFGAGRAVSVLATSAVASALMVWLGRMTSAEKRGAVFGWSVTGRSLGWIMGPMIGSHLGLLFGWRMAFGAEAVLCLLMAPLIAYMYKTMRIFGGN